MSIAEQQIATSVLVIGTGGAGPAGRDRAGRARASTSSPSASGRKLGRAHLARGRRHQRGARHDGPRGHLAAARRRHAARRATCWPNPRTVRDRHRGRGPRHRRPRALRHAVRPRGRRADLAALLRRAHLPPHRLRRRLHRPGDPAHARSTAPRSSASRSSTRSTSPGSSSATTPCSAPTASTSTTGTRYVIHADAVILAAGGHTRIWRRTSSRRDENTGDSFRLAVEAGGRIRDPELVQFHPSGLIEPENAAGTLVSEAARGEGGILRNAPRRAVHDALRPRADGAVHPRPGRARRVHRDQGGPRHPERRRLARRLAPARARRSCAGSRASTRPCSSCRCSTSPASRSRSRPTAHYSMGGVWVRPGGPRHRRRRAVRDRRGGERAARREPARRQLTDRAAGLRPDRRRRRRRRTRSACNAQQRSAAARRRRTRGGRRAPGGRRPGERPRPAARASATR